MNLQKNKINNEKKGIFTKINLFFVSFLKLIGWIFIFIMCILSIIGVIFLINAISIKWVLIIGLFFICSYLSSLIDQIKVIEKKETP